MKLWNKSFWCCWCFSMRTLQLKICSTVLHPALKPACSDDSSSPALDFRWLRIMQSITLLGWLIRLIVLWFLHCLRFPFFGTGIISDCVHSFGHFFCSQIHWHRAVRALTTSLPPFFTSSEGMLSTSGDLPSFRLRTAASTFSFSIGRLSLPSVDGRLVCSNEEYLDGFHSCKALTVFSSPL